MRQATKNKAEGSLGIFQQLGSRFSKQISAETRTHGTWPKSLEDILLPEQEGPARLLLPLQLACPRALTGQVPVCGPAGQSHSAAGDHPGEKDTGRGWTLGTWSQATWVQVLVTRVLSN